MKHNLRLSAITGAVLATGAMALAVSAEVYERSASGIKPSTMTEENGTFIKSPVNSEYFASTTKKNTKNNAPQMTGSQLYYAYPENTDFQNYTIIDANNDGFTWESPGLYGMSYGGGRATLDADDWCILPAVNFDDPNVFYNFYCEARGAMDANPEDFDVCLGTAPTIEAMTTKILEVRDLDYKRDMTLYDSFEKNFTVPGAGNYYIGFHAISPGTSCAFYVRNIYLTKTAVKASSPGQVTDVTVTPDNHGALQAVVNFKMPTDDNNGTAIPASTQVTATVKTPAQSKSVTGAPGSAQSVTVNTVEGENTITITTAIGDNAGLAFTTTTNTGLDIPGAPRILSTKVSEDNMKLTITWEAPTTGANGGFMNPDDTYYFIYKYSEDKEAWTYIDYAYDTEYTATVKPTDPQQNIILGVAAVNSKDEETPEKLYGIASGVIGRPYATPFVEEMKMSATPYGPVVKDVPSEEYDTYLWFGEPGIGLGRYADLPGRNCYIAFSRQAGRTSYSRTLLPKISTKNLTEAQASFYIYINYETPRTEFYITDHTGVETLLGTVDHTSGYGGWTTFTYDIPEQYLGQAWVNYVIKAEYDNGWGQFMTLAGYELTAVMDHDLAISKLTGETSLSSEETGYYTAEVENRGRYEEDLRIKAEVFGADGNLLQTLRLMDNSDNPKLYKGDKAEFHWQFAPTDDQEGDVTLRVTILNEDERADNNVAELNISVSKANRPEIDEFKLTADNEGNAVLSWGTPVIHFHDSFEDCESFDYSDYIGYWLNYDEDMKGTFTFNGLSSFPGSEAAKAWQVFSASESGIVGSNYQAPDGDKYIIAFCPADYSAASDWFLSPLIKGGSSVSFKMNIVGAYDETLDVVYAVKDSPALTDFRVLDSITKTDFGWEEYSYTLPSNATFWGLHYVSADCFGVMVDEIDYKVEFPRDIDGYNIYRNGTRIASDVQGFSYTDKHASKGDKYAMTVSYTNASRVKTEGWMSYELTHQSTSSGVDTSISDVEVVNVVYTTPAGIRVENPDKGVYIRTTEYANGRVVNEKIVR